MRSNHEGAVTGIGAMGRAETAFPYDSNKGSQVWIVVENAIQDLVNNNDIVETTTREYIVGYICKKLEQV
jgi:hypothetical protein